MRAATTTLIIIEILFLLLFGGLTSAAEQAPGYSLAKHPIPKAGSYHLPVLFSAADGAVLDTQGQNRRLHEILDGHLTVLAFIYTSCNDINGCPLSVHVLQRVSLTLQGMPGLRARVQLLTLSFDPVHDTPKVLNAYARSVGNGDTNWHFLTTEDPVISQQITEGFHQSLEVNTDAEGSSSGQIAHALRVFLIDEHHQVRQIYNSSTLKSEMVIADLQTLNLSSSPPADPVKKMAGMTYVASDAFLKPMTGLPPMGIAQKSVPTDAQIELGRKLFFDRRLSHNNTLSCAMCHVPAQGFTSQEQKTSVGMEGRIVRRNAPTLYNIAFAKRLFVDGREFSLENQVWGPLLARNEMGNPSPGFIIERIRNLPDYQGLFKKAFGRNVDMSTMAQALAAYERTLISANSPFDRWFFAKQSQAISPLAQQGYQLFTGKAGCAQCHKLEKQYALLTDHAMHDTGIGYQSSMQSLHDPAPVDIAPGIRIQLSRSQLESVGEVAKPDLGAYEVTLNPEDRWKFRTPTLRNIALTAPYMHDGSLPSLQDVLAFYNQGGIPHEGLDPAIKPLNLDDREMAALLAFMQTLTGSNVDVIVMDSLNAPVGDQAEKPGQDQGVVLH